MIDSNLLNDLSEPFKAKRESALSVLASDSNATVNKQVIELLVLIEGVPSTITDYRERERHLQNLVLKIQELGPSICQSTSHVVLRHLLGSLYVNFSKFWGPTTRALIDIIEGSKFQEQLLSYLLDHLEKTNNYIYDTVEDDPSSEDRPDHVLHRNFLFQILFKFSHYAERESERFVDQFFRFVDKEMMVSPFIEKYTRDNLLSNQVEEKSEELEISDAEGDHDSDGIGTELSSTVFDDGIEGEANDVCSQDIDDNDKHMSKSKLKRLRMQRAKMRKSKISKKNRKKGKKPLPIALIQKRKSRETFLTAAKVIQSFKNIRQVHREAEIKNLALNLLSCRDSSIQKAALNCLMAYDSHLIGPHFDRLVKIIGDKTSRSQLTKLSFFENENEYFDSASRTHLMPLLVRILFGKMISRIGKKTSGKSKSDTRKALVMRFIAGCNLGEILCFFQLLFDPVIEFVETPYHKLDEVLSGFLDYENYVPLNKLQAMLASLVAYIQSIAHLRSDSLPTVMKLLCIITFHVLKPFKSPEVLSNINHKKLNQLKLLRRECMNVITLFFRTFEYYDFDQAEIDYIFNSLIWDSAQSFVDRNYAYPTPLLKFIQCLADVSTYHLLLVKRNQLDRNEYLLKHLMDLYGHLKTEDRVLKILASILDRILNPDQPEPVSDDNLQERGLVPKQMFEDTDAILPEYDSGLYNIQDQPPFGHRVLLKFTPVIFQRLQANCEKFIQKRDSNYKIDNHELSVLSTLSKYILDPTQSIIATRLLLTSLAHQKKADLIIHTIRTAQVLIAHSRDRADDEIVDLVGNVLSYHRNFDLRIEVIKLVSIMTAVDPDLEATGQVLEHMNAMSEEFIESPDLVKWNHGFQLAYHYIDSLSETEIQTVTKIRNSLVLMINQTCFIINNVDKYEFSIRDNCLIFYEKLAKKLAVIDEGKNSAFCNYIIDVMLLEKFIKKGLRDSRDSVKNTFLSVLRSISLECHMMSKTLAELSLFCDSQIELDFWLNIRHIQLHNRSKALARLIADERLHQVSSKTLSSYFMPLASGFLFNRTYKSMASLTENSIKLIGIICKELNWVTYESTLSYYLGLLTKSNTAYQRTNIKLITEILRNFNFDLTNCPEAMEHKLENAKLEKRMRRRLGCIDPVDQESETVTERSKGRHQNASTAKMIFNTVTKKILPKLHASMHEMSRVEFEHDKHMSNYLPEKDEIKRIPIANAIVQLVSLLPCRYVMIRDQLPSVLLKLATFLKSKNEQIRKATRMTLVRVMNFVGPMYLPDMLRIMKQNLDKGFYIHVLNYTIHSVLDKMTLTYGDLDHSVKDLMDNCFKEIFGKPSEDKEIAKVLAKTSEARKTKSFDTLQIIATYITSDKVGELFQYIKGILLETNEPRKVEKISQCTTRVFTGLSKNEKFPIDKMFAFIKVRIEESIPSLRVRQKVEEVESLEHKANDPKFSPAIREDRFIIGKDFCRDRLKSKINERGNLHIIVENSLRLLLNMFEVNKSKIRARETIRRQLDSFIILLSTCLKSSSPKCVMRSLKCIYFIGQTKIDLPNFGKKCNSIVKKIFVLLSLYNGVGMVKGDNFEMIAMCFKTLTLLLLKCEHVTLTNDQLRALMTYIEQDLYDPERQATAFGALHSLLKRRLESPELSLIMSKIADLLVSSEDDKVRHLSRRVWQTYLLDYKHEPKSLKNHLTQFMRQLDYEFIDGRKSVLMILEVAITEFPEKLLNNYFELLFNILSQRLVNEESLDIVKIVERLIALMIQRLPAQQQHSFNKFVLRWAKNQTPEVKLLGVRLIRIYISACKSRFNSRDKIEKILSVILQTLTDNDVLNGKPSDGLHPSTNCSDKPSNDQAADDISSPVTPQNELDHDCLELFRTLLDQEIVSPIEPRYIDKLKRIWQDISSRKLTHSHLPVVLKSCELYVIFIQKTDLVGALQIENPSTDNYLAWNARRIITTLCDRYLDLLDRASGSGQLLTYVNQMMMSLGELVSQTTTTKKFEHDYIAAFGGTGLIDYMVELDDLPTDGFVSEMKPYEIMNSKKKLDLSWLSVKVVMQAKKEAALYRLSEHHRREFVLKWTVAMSQLLGPKRLVPYVTLFMITPIRELTDKGKSKTNHDSPLQKTLLLSEDTLKYIKGLIGIENFNKLYSRIQLHFTKIRIDRKRNAAVAKVRDQARGVKRKLKDNRARSKARRKHSRN